MDSHSLTTYGGWAGIAAIAGGYWYLQKRKAAARPSKVAETVAAKAAPIKKDAKQKIKAVEATFSSGAETEKGNKKKNARKNKNTTKDAAPAVAILAQKAPQVAQDSEDEGSEEIDNKEFARQLSQAKSGLQMGSKPQAAGRQKSVKQSRANVNGFNTTDADADDDSESARSNQGGVADMLEAPSAGPSSIRITAPTNAQPQKEKKAAKAPEPVETKKQRQNRKKREEEQEARAEAEAQRKVDEEKQRRTARLAEGRAAKDGSASMAKAAAASVWKGPEGPNSAPTNGHIQLLDTVEQPAAPQQKNVSTEYSVLPSEEEQMRQLQQEDSWQSVPSKKSKAKKNTKQENVKPVAEASTPVDAPASTYVSARERQQKPETKKNGLAQVEYRGEDGQNETATYNLKEEVWQV